METDTSSRTWPRPEWTRRFAYRVMLLRREIDTASAVTLGHAAFDNAADVDPEDAAERYVGDNGVGS